MRVGYLFGVEGIILCLQNSSPLSPVVSKASSGAMEVMNLYSTHNLSNFFMVFLFFLFVFLSYSLLFKIFTKKKKRILQTRIGI